ncbi:MAG: TauD/TfdA family dioxygenase [Sphingomonadales bacterium]|nr:MAG: TauD/TfdA family dioxygenase [Sphingomonadales bacterium]
MAWTKSALHPLFGARLTGPRLDRPLREDDRTSLVAAVETHGLVVLPDQPLDDDLLVAATEQLGEIDRVGQKVNIDQTLVFRVTNVADDGGILPLDDRMFQINIANQLWHTDSTYVRPGSKFSILHARVSPPEGGDTEFCDTRVAWERLDPALRERIAPLIAMHSLRHSRRKAGFDGWSEQELAGLDTVPRPLVHHHTPSGRTALCLASHIGEIAGMDDAEAASLLDMLIEQATRPELVHTHRWSVGDLLIWDNRCTMHRATPFDHRAYKRDLRTLRVTDTDASPLQLTIGPWGRAAALS